MSFSDHKITEFIHRVGDLPDQPTLSPQELKQRFDSSPEELRRAHNAICDEGERLSARVEGIVVDTFGDTIDREMLSHELAAELDGKAEQTALAAETAARENLAETVAQKCECYFGTYTGDGKASQFINLGFTPKAVLLLTENGRTAGDGHYYGGLALTDAPIMIKNDHPLLQIAENGFHAYQETYFNQAYVYIYGNNKGTVYHYLALR